MSISTECRDESFAQIDKKNRKEEVLAVFKEGECLTAREVLHIIKPNSDNMNYVRPRITELCNDGYLEEWFAKYDENTNRSVTAWRLVTEKQMTLRDYFPKE